MKICYIADIQNPHSRRWAGDFAALGHEVLVLSDADAPRGDPAPKGVRVATPRWRQWEKILAFKVYPPPYGNNRWKYLPYRRALGAFEPDLVHGMEALYNGYTTAKLLGDQGPPRILMPWGGDIACTPFESPRARKLVEFALHHAEHVVGNMPSLPDFLNAHFGVSRQKVSGFSWGVDLAIFRDGLAAEAEALRERLGVPPGAAVVLSPRNFAPYWGIETIVHSAPEVAKRLPDVFFVFLTGARDKKFVEESMLWLKRQERWHHVRVVEETLSPPEMAALFNLADVFVTVPETDFLAQTLLEGMACGCVPICRDLEAYRTRVEEGVTGRYAAQPFGPESLANAILDTLGDRVRLREMSANAAAQAIRLDDWRTGLRKMAEVYARVTGREEFMIPASA
jgi:glycosyltransferase involved in cell wall biosynthesis